jgi:hypothetical protein
MSNPTGPISPNVKPPTGPTGATGASCSPQGATIGNIPVNPAPNFPHGWATISIPMGGWGYISAIPTEPEAKKKDNRDGCDCKKCKEFFPYAEPNQEDGTLICYRCRIGW